MRKETFFSLNRYYLLGSILLGLLVPYLGGLVPENHASAVLVSYNPTYIDYTPIITEGASFSILTVITIVYKIGVLFMLVRLMIGLHQVWTHYHNGHKERHDNIVLVTSDKSHLPFSFFNIVFLSNTVKLNGDIEQILKHEIVHADQMHSFDVIFMEIIQIVFWFNPILILYKQAIRSSHEYLADAYVIKDEKIHEYRQLLVSHASSGLEAALSNQFFHSQIKNRITMMYKDKSKGSALVKYLVAVPIVLILLFSFSSKKDNDLIDAENNIKTVSVDSLLLPKGTFPPTHDELFGNAYNENSPLLVVDGEIVQSLDYPKTASYSMESLCAFTKEEAISRYGEEGRNGVYEISGLTMEIHESNDTLRPPPPISAPPPPARMSSSPAPAPKVYGMLTNPSIDDPIIYVDGYLLDRKDYPIGEKIAIRTIDFLEPGDAVREYGQQGKNGVYKLTGVSFSDKRLSQDDDVYNIVDQLPRFPGCEDMKGSDADKKKCADQKMLEYIYGILKYPEAAIEQGVEGMAVIRFMVDLDGSIKDIRLIRDPGAETGEAARQVVASMNNMDNKWIPGEQGGKKVKVMYTLPIKFKLEGDKTENFSTKKNLETDRQDRLAYDLLEFSPNPANGSVNVKIQLPLDDPAELQFVTVENKLLKKINITNGKFDQNVAIDYVGIIYMSVIQNKKVIYKKIVMQ